MSASRVHISKVPRDDFETIDRIVTATLENLPPPDWDPSRPVYVKVNAVCQSSPEEGYDTHPQVAVSTALHFRKLGFRVLIGENEGRDILEKTGVAPLADKYDIPIHDPLSDLVETPIPTGFILKKTLISKTVLESHPVSVPKFKTHLEAIMSLSLKNMKGCIGGRLPEFDEDERIRYHRTGMHECIADINLAMRPKLAVVDAIYAMEGIGPARAMSKLRRLGLVIVGYDPVAVDTVCCRIAGAQPDQVKHIRLAARHGLGTCDEDNIQITGLSLDSARAPRFQLPPTDPAKMVPFKGVELLMGKACSNCISAVATALMMLKNKGFTLPDEKLLQLVVGPNPPAFTNHADARVIVGRCLEKSNDGFLVRGCPPAASFIMEALEKFAQK